MEFFDTLRQVQRNWQPYKKWDIEQQKKEKQNELLRKKYPPTPQELEHARQYGRTIVDVINTMDQYSIDKSEDASLAIQNVMFGLNLLGGGIGCAVSVSLKSIPKFKNKINAPEFVLGVLGLTIGSSITNLIGKIWGAQVEKQASRIARYQTRENDLKDSRNFVVYDETQIKKAEEIAKTLPEINYKKNDLTLKKSFNPIASIKKAKKTTDELKKDSKAYKQWQEKFEKTQKAKVENFPNIKVSPQELSKAEKDRDNILHTIKKIETYSLNYMMNMKLAIFSSLLALNAASLGIGFGIFGIINHLQNKNILKPKSALINWGKTAGIRYIPLIVILTTIGPTIKLLKDAARVGRFKAKQELLKHPENFISFDEKQRSEIKNDTEQDTNKVSKPSISFIANFKRELKQFKKDYIEYHNYMNNGYKQELKLQEALKQVDITKEQEAQAKELQKKAFLSFEKMDEKAQRFIDDTDAGVDTLRHTIITTISTVCKIFMFSIFIKKAKIYNKGKALSFTDTYTLFKYFTPKEILTIIGVGLIPAAFDVPMAIKGIEIKKEAGKIGIMKAMQDLNDPKNFLDDKENKS